jgi:hypothetical protein
MQTVARNTQLKTSEKATLFMQNSESRREANAAVVVSIHDVSTITRARVERMLEDLASVGIGITSLLVIPDHHGRGRIDADAEFSAWMRARVCQGHEAVLHGWRHLRRGKKEEGLATRFMTRFYTAGEGEFYDLSLEEARGLLRQGREALLRCGVTTRGFIAPAWLLGDAAERAVREEGFDYTTRIATVIDCKEGWGFAARSMVYSVRAGWRRGVSLLWNELLFRSLKNAPLLRIGLHPPDWDHAAIRSHILQSLRQAVALRQVMTYQDWLDQARSGSHEEKL